MPLPLDLIVLGASTAIELRANASTIIVGANGSGKTRLAIECERQLSAGAHRISAQRMLTIDPSIEKVSEETAFSQLRFGNANSIAFGTADQTRLINRWGQNQPRFVLNDANALLQVLFAQQANIAVKSYNASADRVSHESEETFMRKLSAIFRQVLPNRKLYITADNITASATDEKMEGEPYSITQMSDGEKAILYLIGQVIVANKDSVLILDEPEIHVHRSILGRLWDALEAARPDCAFLLITHDLEFAASRPGQKYVVRSYAPATGWTIESVPEMEGFSEELITLILGSRRPILFVEGEQGSFDLSFYRACYPGWTVVPRGGCESVIHSVTSMRRNSSFTRIDCAGLVDADGHDESDRMRLANLGIQILPVSEIENLLLLPAVSRAILEMNDLGAVEVDRKLAELKAAIFAEASTEKNRNEVILGFCRRRIDRALKQIDFSADKSIADLAASYVAKTGELDVVALASEISTNIENAVADDDLPALLAVYDRKRPLLALASSHLRNWKTEVFSAWVVRAIQSPRDDRLRHALRVVLPVLATV